MAHLDFLFNACSSTAKIWTVPLSLATHKNEESVLKLMLQNIRNKISAQELITKIYWQGLPHVEIQPIRILCECYVS